MMMVAVQEKAVKEAMEKNQVIALMEGTCMDACVYLTSCMKKARKFVAAGH